MLFDLYHVRWDSYLRAAVRWPHGGDPKRAEPAAWLIRQSGETDPARAGWRDGYEADIHDVLSGEVQGHLAPTGSKAGAEKIWQELIKRHGGRAKVVAKRPASTTSGAPIPEDKGTYEFANLTKVDDCLHVPDDQSDKARVRKKPASSTTAKRRKTREDDARSGSEEFEEVDEAVGMPAMAESMLDEHFLAFV